MTETRTESLPVIPVGQALGQAVGQAQTILTRLLTGVLTETGTPRETYLALLRLSVNGDSSLQRDRYVRDLSDSLGLDLWAAGELADGMLDAGLLTLAGETIRLADAGAELRERTRRSVGTVTAPLYEGLDPADIETTVRTLQDITSRAREL
jgi:hypothetical protein